MNKIKTVLTATFAMLILMGCSMDINGRRKGSGGVNVVDDSQATVKKSIKISNFDEITAMSGIKIVFTQGKFTGTAEVATTPSAEKYLVVEVKDKELHAYYKNHNGNINGATTIRVQAPELEEISLTSAASVLVNGPLKINKDLDISLTSASQVTLDDVSGGELEIDLTSASSVTAGNVNVSKLDIGQTSASSLNINSVTAKELEIECTSASKCYISAFNGGNSEITATSGAGVTLSRINAGNIDASATSGGNINLDGTCKSLTERSSSGGSVSTRKLSGNPSKRSEPHKKKKTRTSSSSGTVMPREP